MAAEAGAELTMMENRFVPARFKDGYGPVGAWFLLFKVRPPMPWVKFTWKRTKPCWINIRLMVKLWCPPPVCVTI
jgi:hypothetical protein